MLKLAIAALLVSVQALAGNTKPTITATSIGPGKSKFDYPLNCVAKQPKVSVTMEEDFGEQFKFTAKIDPNLCRLLYIHSLDNGEGTPTFTFYIANDEIVAYMLHDPKRNPEGRLEIKPIE